VPLAASAISGPEGCALNGTAGFGDLPADESSAGFESYTAAPAGLPDQVHLRTTTESFNRRWSFAARSGQLFTKPAAAKGGWRTVALPPVLQGRIVGVSADDDEVMLIDRDGRFFTMDHALNAPATWNWTHRYGTPLWLGPGNKLPADTITWSWSVISPNEDRVWRDTAGNDHGVGLAKVSHVFALTDGGRRIRYIDPWLPVDHSYEMATPHGGRFQAVALSTSASTTLITNRYGDLYTRLYDFDISGSDKVFFRYSYRDQRGKPEAPDLLVERFDTRYAAIQLPAPDWVRQPKIPGTITSKISVARTAPGSAARELRVEGRSGGQTGYWVKQLNGPSWAFVPTGEPLAGAVLENSSRDRSTETLAPPSPYSYAGDSERGFSAEVRNFDVAATPTPLTIKLPSGARIKLVLHTVDGLRQTPQLPGISKQYRLYDGTIEVPSALRKNLAAQPAEVQAFLKERLGGKRFTDTPVYVTESLFQISGLGVRLLRQ